MSDELERLDRLHIDLHLASVAAFTALLWDWAITFSDEVELIWTKRNDSWLKWMFLFTRYYILLSSLAGRIVDGLIIYGYPLRVTAVRIWWASEVLVASHSMHALELLLMMRVYALWNRPRWMAIMFAIMFTLENILVIIGIVAHLPDPDTFVVLNILLKLPHSFVYFGLSNMVVQVVIMVLTIHKYRKEQWKTIPIAKLVLRDGTVAFCTISTVGCLMSFYAVFDIYFATAPFPWLLVAISAVTTRLITNMQRLPQNGVFERGQAVSTAIQFTTVLSNDVDSSDQSTVHRTPRDFRRTPLFSAPTSFVSPYENVTSDDPNGIL
ncbi:hypothetical protein BKA70DRAFT_1272900 [Coprinopsis sp. MPI-PUGE-AT-0042]|nr:hypothetical protein BKA70DRAFT_1272900 [Coprinopsis sp. MPI-PUGE-AT-0042]